MMVRLCWNSSSFTGQPTAPTLADTVDLALTASHTGTFSIGQTGVLTLAVNNIGRKATSSPLVLTDILPEGTSYQSASGTGWECQADGRVVTCSYPGTLAPGGATIVNLDVRVTATPSTLDPSLGAEHLASIQTNGEADFLNNGIVDFIVLPPAANHQVFLTLPGGGAVPTSTMGSAGELVAGYAVGTVTTGTAPYGTAVFSYTQNGIVVSEVGVPASPPTLAARFFVDTRTGVRTGSSNATINILTGFAAVNMGSTGATLSLRLRGENGSLLTPPGTIRLARGEHMAKFLDQLAPDFILPAGFINNGLGTLEITSDQPVSVLALRLTTNQRGELLMTSTPVADLSQPAPAGVLSFPQIADGGGYQTTLTLMNTSNATESGVIEFFDDTGSPLPVGTTNGGPANSQFPYSILAGGFLRLETDGLPPVAKVGWARLTPAAGTTAPVSAAIFGFTQGNVLVTESGVPAVTATTHARIYVDKSGGHDTGLAVANPGNSGMRITATAFQPDGVTPAGNAPGTIDLSPMGHLARFAGQFIDDLPVGFTGVLDLSSTSPFVALTLRSLMNARGDFLVTTFPIADANQPAPAPLVFPQIADGSGYQSQIILLSTGGPAATITVNYLGNDGNPVAIGRASGNAVRYDSSKK